MEKLNGVYVMPCNINGLSLKFIFDTGAADVSISLKDALFMLKNGYLSDQDILGTEKYRFGNGVIEEGTKIILRNISIGNQITLYNVQASVMNNMDAPLLLGQTALMKLGKIQFDYSNNTLTIFKKTPSNSLQKSKVNSTIQSECHCFKQDEMVLTSRAGLYNIKNELIIVINRNVCIRVVTKNTCNKDFWYVDYHGFRGYIIKNAFE